MPNGGVMDRDVNINNVLDQLDDIRARLDIQERFGISTIADIGAGVNPAQPEYNIVNFGAVGANDTGDGVLNQKAFMRAFECVAG